MILDQDEQTRWHVNTMSRTTMINTVGAGYQSDIEGGEFSYISGVATELWFLREASLSQADPGCRVLT